MFPLIGSHGQSVVPPRIGALASSSLKGCARYFRSSGAMRQGENGPLRMQNMNEETHAAAIVSMFCRRSRKRVTSWLTLGERCRRVG